MTDWTLWMREREEGECWVLASEALWKASPGLRVSPTHCGVSVSYSLGRFQFVACVSGSPQEYKWFLIHLV